MSSPGVGVSASLAFDTTGSDENNAGEGGTAEATLTLNRHVLVAIEEKRRRLGSPVLSTAEATLLFPCTRCHAAMRVRCLEHASQGVVTRTARPEV
jgi:hypothetical protein